jgi:serine/threonine-protein kinase
VPLEQQYAASPSLPASVPLVVPNGAHAERSVAAGDASSSLITVAENSNDRRAFLQERIALLFKTIALISLSFFIISAIVFVLLAEGEFSPLYGWESRWHLGSIVLQAAIWLVARRGKVEDEWLRYFDAGGTLLTCSSYALMVLQTQGDNGCFLAVLPTLTTLVTRAVLIPSTPRRTLVISALAFVPTIAVTFVLGRVMQSVALAHVLTATIYVTTWASAIVAVCTLTSRIIYGLEQKVREARQLGQYTLAERIGEGGMGVVYRARHAMLRRPTAVKVLPPERMGEQNLRRFEREVQLTSQLTHPNTISIYDYGRTADGLFYYAMEYLEGFTLTELVQVGGPLPPARLAALLRQVAGSIHEAHQIGLIHRDIKPDNIVVCERGGMCDVAKVLDFGLVKDIRETGDPALSQVNAIIGTPHYMSPEAITLPRSVGVPSDIYSLGATAYYLLVGRHVFEAKTLVEICSHHLMTVPEAPSAVLGHPVPEALENVILACLAKNPAERPASAADLERALAAVAETHPWTQDEARSWWQEHRDSLQRSKTSRASTVPLGNSVVLRSTTWSSKPVAPTG